MISQRFLNHFIPISILNFSRQNFGNHINITFDYKGREKWNVKAKLGSTILQIAQENKIPLIGACEGNKSCGGCHVILSKDLFKKLPKPDEDEEDLLSLITSRKPESRLGCQIKINKDFEGETIQIPLKRF